ncbi:hypothetical protein G4D82_13910 [Flavobacterium sp. CYK-4]|uniref:hypothetical protein n=1 Tax=Flavobacterium lotistagni TaxID=2709660 RepID=UPI00140CC591|nr:hypothetical protein [Flavobacterium lotistagni]NHM08319.1 hypothetical protein [Flavobacterium lotistagni]
MKNRNKPIKSKLYNRISRAERERRNKERIRRILPHNNFKEYYREYIGRERHSETIKPKDNFELLKEPQDVISFVEILKSFKYRDDILEVKINLDDVKTIDIGALSLLLSSVEELSLNDKNVSGSVPKNKDAYDFLAESGFFRNISNLSKRLSNRIETNKKKNQNLLLIGYPSTKGKGKLIGENIKSAMGALTGIPQHYRAIYTLVMEMNANSIEHAYEKDKKHWVFGINYKEEENKLYFTFTDNGFGILKQLDIRLDRRVKELFKRLDLSNGTMLKNLFDKKYNSRFKTQINRNRGLPIIQNKAVNRSVNNLICITNNVYLNLQTRDDVKLNGEFSGTFYYWELDLKLFNENARNFN